MKHELDIACKNFADKLRNSSSYNTKKSIVYKKSATLLVVRRDMVGGK
jgi:hypothetical protein